MTSHSPTAITDWKIYTMDSEDLSFVDAKEGSPDSMASYEARYEKKWGKDVKIWNPFLESFTVFPELPIEIRQTIWKLTLQPRVVEVKYSSNHGFYTSVNPPVALSVNKDSRDAIKYLYPMCFGNFMHEAAIVFNFSKDTLYFDTAIGPQVVSFLFGLKQEEGENIQSLAVDRYLDDYLDEWGFLGDVHAFDALQKATRSMPALKEVYAVIKLDEYWDAHGFPEGNGPIELWEYMPDSLQTYMGHEGIHMDDEDGMSNCAELPNMDDFLEPYQAPTKSAIWGRRPTELTLEPVPWEADGPDNVRKIIRG